MDFINDILGPINNVIWHNWVLYIVLGVGVLFTVWSGFCQYRALSHGVQVTRGKYDDPNDPGAINHFQALSAALSATVGLGNIAGVGVAVALGGPGAVFWMWMVGLFGMALKTTEVCLSMLYRNTDDPDNPHGGPMFVAAKAFKERGMPGVGKVVGSIFVVTLLISAITGGNMFQSWSVGEITENYFQVPSIVSGIILAVLVAAVIIGGIKRIGAVAGRIVPFMCVLYLLAALVVLVMNIGVIPEMLRLIVVEAFTPSEATGAFMGGTAGYALLWGMKRALFSSECGQGSSPIAHSAAKTDEPVREAVVAGLEPFIDTIVVCTLTALVILTTGAFNRGPETSFDPASLSVTFNSEKGGDLPAAPTLTFDSFDAETQMSTWTISAVTAPSTRIPTAQETEDGDPPTAWESGEEVTMLVPNPNEGGRMYGISGRVRDGQLQFDNLVVPGQPENLAIADATVYHGAAPSWTVQTPTAMPSRTPDATRVSGSWRGGEDLFVVVHAHHNPNTGLDLHRMPGAVAKAGEDPATVTWASFEAPLQPRLANDDGAVFVEYPGPSLTGHAFDRTIPGLGKWLVTLAAWLFALSTMISWSYYGEQGMVFLFGEKSVLAYKLFYCLMIIVAAWGFIETDAELDALTSLGTGVMLWANIPIMLIFGGLAMRAYHDYFRRFKSGEMEGPHGAPSITDVVEGRDVE